MVLGFILLPTSVPAAVLLPKTLGSRQAVCGSGQAAAAYLPELPSGCISSSLLPYPVLLPSTQGCWICPRATVCHLSLRSSPGNQGKSQPRALSKTGVVLPWLRGGGAELLHYKRLEVSQGPPPVVLPSFLINKAASTLGIWG